jgi:putative SOS response-associated peptidase YedK
MLSDRFKCRLARIYRPPVSSQIKLISMCGRYRRRSDKQRIAEAFEVGMGLDDLYLEADDDAAPGSIQPVVLTNDNGERQIELMRWGFKTTGQFLFNARSEEITTTNFWKDSFSNRRCIIPADSFYEWQQVKSGKKPKYEFTVPGRAPFGMAGVWSSWKNPKTRKHEPTFAILTCEANGVILPVHDRQPTILEPRDYEEWLIESERPPVHLLRLLPDKELKAERVESADEMTDEQVNLFDSL